ncbi:hypothetical protein DPMN_176503 [Dreissena polymorpha]|uniref:Uncharacterized protein n=1 Tax=Dreissena polymorpha TaxID=45954 RepID=A0A9D4EA91_DREPO|nr:hypothetical protein DPMN_176503 [Dreissena polymorpha]
MELKLFCLSVLRLLQGQGKHSKTVPPLEGHEFFIREQFPPEIVKRRRKLFLQLKVVIGIGSPKRSRLIGGHNQR